MSKDLMLVIEAVAPRLSDTEDKNIVSSLALQTFVLFIIVNYLAKKANPLLRKS